ncbi:MAG TPA: hypothetical protein VF503_00180 [Sphingobium sp.]|uniref:hypothetical protein n=1 Tax=Sphingobium sp. TaxID=1912891 RepID=UPI002ED6036D
MSAQHTPGPLSVHNYSGIQGRKLLNLSDGRTVEVAAITIGAGRTMIGEVRYSSEASGFPTVNDHGEMLANAALFIAAPDLVKAADIALGLILGGRLYEQQCCDGHMCGCQGSTYADEAEHFLRAALAKARDVASVQAALDALQEKAA